MRLPPNAHISRQIQPWPSDLHYQDARRLELPLTTRIPLPDQPRSFSGNAAQQCVDKTGWMLTQDQTANKKHNK
jgi:hypothetical protein